MLLSNSSSPLNVACLDLALDEWSVLGDVFAAVPASCTPAMDATVAHLDGGGQNRVVIISGWTRGFQRTQQVGGD